MSIIPIFDKNRSQNFVSLSISVDFFVLKFDSYWKLSEDKKRSEGVARNIGQPKLLSYCTLFANSEFIILRIFPLKTTWNKYGSEPDARGSTCWINKLINKKRLLIKSWLKSIYSESFYGSFLCIYTNLRSRVLF